MVKLLVDGEENDFTTTIFPDGTSQVWKLEQLPVTAFGMVQDDDIKILWLFEREAELFHVCQLAQLVKAEYGVYPTLVAPYLPYGRQDKKVSNSTSFARDTMIRTLRAFGITDLVTFDAHSEPYDTHPSLVESERPVEFHESIFNHDVVCFPDKGAVDRYGATLAGSAPLIFCEKVRDQLTGNITGLQINQSIIGLDIKKTLLNKKVLIIDDICDGGMTFIKVAEALKPYGPAQIDLAVSHGLFSKGKQCLHDAGITNIFTTNSLLRNPEGFKVW